MIDLNAGDIFCVHSKAAHSKAINWVQKFWAKDNKAKYSHSGIILDSQGKTFEALWKIRKSSMGKYKGKQVIIGRYEGMPVSTFLKGLKGVAKYEGEIYPFYKLFLHMFPPAAKYMAFDKVVCSELTAKFLYKAELLPNWRGWNPDDLADMIQHWRGWKIVYEGKWE